MVFIRDNTIFYYFREFFNRVCQNFFLTNYCSCYYRHSKAIVYLSITICRFVVVSDLPHSRLVNINEQIAKAK